jgi:hypothetical protein
MGHESIERAGNSSLPSVPIRADFCSYQTTQLYRHYHSSRPSSSHILVRILELRHQFPQSKFCQIRIHGTNLVERFRNLPKVMSWWNKIFMTVSNACVRDTMTVCAKS